MGARLVYELEGMMCKEASKHVYAIFSACLNTGIIAWGF